MSSVTYDGVTSLGQAFCCNWRFAVGPRLARQPPLSFGHARPLVLQCRLLINCFYACRADIPPHLETNRSALRNQSEVQADSRNRKPRNVMTSSAVSLNSSFSTQRQDKGAEGTGKAWGLTTWVLWALLSKCLTWSTTVVYMRGLDWLVTMVLRLHLLRLVKIQIKAILWRSSELIRPLCHNFCFLNISFLIPMSMSVMNDKGGFVLSS